jgi:hypothetical protein
MQISALAHAASPKQELCDETTERGMFEGRGHLLLGLLSVAVSFRLTRARAVRSPVRVQFHAEALGLPWELKVP